MEKEKVVKERLVKVVVIEGSAPIPHIVMRKQVSYRFEPICEVPEEMAKGMILTYPNVYALYAGGKIDMSKYEVVDGYAGTAVEKLFKQLSADEQMEVLELIKGKLRKATTEVKGVSEQGAVEDEFKPERVNVEELRKWLKGHGVRLPEQATKKEHFVALVKRRQMFNLMSVAELRKFAKANKVELPEDGVEKQWLVYELVLLLEEQLDR